MKGVERVRELQAAAADVRMIGRQQHDLRRFVHLRARLGDRLAANRHVSAKDERAGAFARRRQALDRSRVDRA
jgi:hypothetical protein